MLTELTIKNVALIDSAVINLCEGLNVLCGETGAGKSVILDSLNFVLGAKADKTMIRYGESSCFVQAVFCDVNAAVRAELDEQGIDFDGDVIISRKFSMDGRGDIKVNGNTVNSAILRRITQGLVDVHGQSEHFFLLKESNQLHVLDKYSADAIADLKLKLAEVISQIKRVDGDLRLIGDNEAERARRIDVLEYQINEIETAAFAEGDEERLIAEFKKLNNIEKLLENLNSVIVAFENDGGVIDGLIVSEKNVSSISDIDDELTQLSNRIEGARIEAEDVLDCVKDYFSGLEFDEKKAQETEERMELLKSLKRKYGGSLAAIFEFEARAAEELDLLKNSAARFDELTKEKEALRNNAFIICGKITKLRKSFADKFCKEVIGELITLNIKNARFCVNFAEYSIEDVKRVTADGLDKIEFMFSANSGEPLKPLSKIISGGEMSRFMLAIKTCMSDVNGIDTYVFDEIDAGISGLTAKVVAEKFAKIAQNKQIIAVSHLAQIAAMSDKLLNIVKTEGAEKTSTNVFELSDDAILPEIIRLIGGDNNSPAALAHAKALRDECLIFKNSL